MNIIFLDIDGVLNSLPYFESIKGVKYDKYNEISNFHLKKLSEIKTAFSYNIEDFKFHRFQLLFNVVLDYIYYPWAIYMLLK